MTNDEKLRLLQAWQADMQNSDTLINPVIAALKLDPQSAICESVWRLQDALTAAIARETGFSSESLRWYAQDNDFGNKGLEAGTSLEIRKINNLSDFLWFDGVRNG